MPLGDSVPERLGHDWDAELDPDAEGWARSTRAYWLANWPGFTEHFFSRCFTEPHSTKQIEDSVGWSLETDPETMLADVGSEGISRDEVIRIAGELRCPALVIQGTEDAITGPDEGGRAGGGDRVPARHRSRAPATCRRRATPSR